MASIVYTAKRAIKTGHTSGTSYTLNILFLQDTPGTQRVGPRPAVALNGSQVTTTHRVDQTRDLLTDYVSASSAPSSADMVEFLTSVIGGETFSIDGVNYKLSGDTFGEKPEGNIYRNYSFKVRAV